MDILVNNSKIDFKLENETILKEVVDDLNNWAKAEGFIINDILYDNKPYDLNDNKCKNTPVSAISKIKINAIKREEMHHENLELLYQYVTLFKKAIEVSNDSVTDELKREAKPICRLLSSFLGENFDNEESFSKVLLNNISQSDNAETRNILIKQFSALIIKLQERIFEFSDPVGELKKTIKKLHETEKELLNISVLLQTEKDKEAWNSIIKFSDLNQKLLRLYPLLLNSGLNIEAIKIEDLSFIEYYSELDNVLNELIEAFTSSDSVLMGDLIEYEIVPRLSGLIQALENILKDVVL